MPQIKALTEILVEEKFFTSTRSANGAIKHGEIYVEGLRVANPLALLVITAPTVIQWRNENAIFKEVTIE